MGQTTITKLHTTVGTVYKYLSKAIQAREDFYQGQAEAAELALTERQPNMGPEDAKFRFGKSQKGMQLIADNKWHMAQSRTFALASIASGVLQLVYEQRETNRLLREQIKLLTNIDKEANGG